MEEDLGVRGRIPHPFLRVPWSLESLPRRRKSSPSRDRTSVHSPIASPALLHSCLRSGPRTAPAAPSSAPTRRPAILVTHRLPGARGPCGAPSRPQESSSFCTHLSYRESHSGFSFSVKDLQFPLSRDIACRRPACAWVQPCPSAQKRHSRASLTHGEPSGHTSTTDTRVWVEESLPSPEIP